MAIQWFPGHMHKARREIQEKLAEIDLFIELLDARVPASSANPMLAELAPEKPRLKVLTKSDLADPVRTEAWLSALTSKRQQVVVGALNDATALRTIPKVCRALLGRHDDRKQTTALIMGIPNVGKSSLINLLTGKKIAKTGDEPAITKGLQRIALELDVVLLDSPGLLWPKLISPHAGYRLAATGAIKPTAFTFTEVGLYALEFLSREYAHALAARYRLEVGTHSAEMMLTAIGRQRGCLRKGGVVDLELAAQLLINDIRAGQLGRMTWEMPVQVAQEQAEAERLEAEKQAKRLARKR
ncbi:MAG: ribosome biogenesis GTPase YlqF [Methylococcales bacterium]|nr:ribosome biogenesis GTPase YlqF [Methylococcales bacterium]